MKPQQRMTDEEAHVEVENQGRGEAMMRVAIFLIVLTLVLVIVQQVQIHARNETLEHLDTQVEKIEANAQAIRDFTREVELSEPTIDPEELHEIFQAVRDIRVAICEIDDPQRQAFCATLSPIEQE